MPIKFWVWIIPISPSFFLFPSPVIISTPSSCSFLLPSSLSEPPHCLFSWMNMLLMEARPGCKWVANSISHLSMPSPNGCPACQLYHGQLFDGVPWLMNYRLHTHFNLLVLTHMSLISVLIRPGTAHSLPNNLWAGPFPAIHFSYVEKCNSRVFSTSELVGEISPYSMYCIWHFKLLYIPISKIDITNSCTSTLWHFLPHRLSALYKSLTLFFFNTQSVLKKRPNGRV